MAETTMSWKEGVVHVMIVLAATLACDEPTSNADGDEDGKKTSDDEAEESAKKKKKKKKKDTGPCGDLSIDSIDAAFDKKKLNACVACCNDKAPDAVRAYYHFADNKPPGRCRCVLPVSDCTKAKDLATCQACCEGAGKASAKFEKGAGCSCGG